VSVHIFKYKQGLTFVEKKCRCSRHGHGEQGGRVPEIGGWCAAVSRTTIRRIEAWMAAEDCGTVGKTSGIEYICGRRYIIVEPGGVQGGVVELTTNKENLNDVGKLVLLPRPFWTFTYFCIVDVPPFSGRRYI